MQKDITLVFLVSCLVAAVSYGIMRDCPCDLGMSVENLAQRNLQLEQELYKLRSLRSHEQEDSEKRLKESRKKLEKCIALYYEKSKMCFPRP